MTWPTSSFGTLSSPVSLSLLDGMFAQIAAMVALPCSASGSNAITLTPLTSVPQPSALVTGVMVYFRAAGNSSTAVTIALGSIAAAPLVCNDGTTQVTNQLVSGLGYLAIYDSTAASWELTAIFPGSVAGNILTYQTSGAPAFVTPGATGAMALINTLTASNVASVSDTTSLTATYSYYMIALYGFTATTSALQFQVHSGGAFKVAGYLSTAGWVLGTAVQTTDAPTTFSEALPQIRVRQAGAILMIDNPSTSGVHNIMSFGGGGDFNAATLNPVATTAGGQWTTAGVVDGFLLQYTTGNILTGTVKVYGIT